MKYSEKIKPITYLKNHTADITKEVTSTSAPIIITHNGRAKLIVQDVKVYEEQKEALILLKLIAQSQESLKKGKYKSLKDSFRSVRKRVRTVNEKI